MAQRRRADLLARIRDGEEAMALAMVRHRLARIVENRLTASQLHALVVLDAHGPQPASELARALGVSAATVTGLVDRLVRDGLADRRPDPADGRSRVVHATDAGLAAWRTAIVGPTSIDEDVLALLTDDDLALVLAATEAVRRAVTQVTRTGSAAAVDGADTSA